MPLAIIADEDVDDPDLGSAVLDSSAVHCTSE